MCTRNNALIKSEKIVYIMGLAQIIRKQIQFSQRVQQDMNNKQFSNRIMLLHKSQYESNMK